MPDPDDIDDTYGAVAKWSNAPGCLPGFRGFKSRLPRHSVAVSPAASPAWPAPTRPCWGSSAAEQLFYTQRRVGSSPTPSTTIREG